MISLLALTVWALNERREAICQRDTAVSRQLASQARGVVSGNPDLGLLLAASAYRNASTLEARQSLEVNLLARPRLQKFLWGHSGGVTTVAFSPDGRLLAAGGEDDKKVMMWNVASGALLFETRAAD